MIKADPLHVGFFQKVGGIRGLEAGLPIVLPGGRLCSWEQLVRGVLSGGKMPAA